MIWYRNNQPLTSNDDCEINVEEGVSTIKIRNVDKKKVGKYEVVIENTKHVTAKSASTIKLLKAPDESEITPPVFTKLIRPTRIHLGDIVMLETEVKSSPCASFQWFVGTTEIASYAKQNKLNNITITNKDNVSCLCIEDITKEFIGVVTCRAENFAGSVACSASMLLDESEKESVGEAPVILTPLVPTTVMDGEPIELTCEAIGQPWPSVEWYHGESLIQKARDVTMARLQSGLCEIRIREAFPEMSGKYKCVATNEFGSCTTESVVDVEGRTTVYCFSKCMELVCMLSCDSSFIS